MAWAVPQYARRTTNVLHMSDIGGVLYKASEERTGKLPHLEEVGEDTDDRGSDDTD